MSSNEVSLSANPAYQYQKLTEPDAIRLILLLPSDDLQSPLVCELISTTLSHYQNELLDHYTALSYVWGDPSLRATMKVAGRALSITASLDTALRHLRDSSRTRRIWADALCINQNDFEERNQQVRQMASVYTVAQHTVIWIGEGTAETNELFKTLRLLSSQRLLGRSVEDSERSGVSRDVVLSASQTILARQWFKRVWVLQELVRSRDPWVQCGTFLVKWQDLKCHITAAALDIGEEKVQVLDDMARLHAEHQLGSFRNLSDPECKDPRIVAGKLLTLLTSRRALGVQDPRDMLFAHVGLLGNARIDDSLLRLIEVDYGKEESLVFFEIARFLTEAFQDYRILSLLEYRHMTSLSHLPSWVPDWTATSPSKFETLSSALKLEDTISATYFPPNPRCLNFGCPSPVHWLSKTCSYCWGRDSEKVTKTGSTYSAIWTPLIQQSSSKVQQTSVKRNTLFEMESKALAITSRRNYCYRNKLRCLEDLGLSSPTSLFRALEKKPKACFGTGDWQLLKMIRALKGISGPQIDKSGNRFMERKKIEHFKVIGECFVEGLMYGEAYKRYKADLTRQPRVLALH
ncbi:heterokaryon incompatibility protein-domain-containing protein [Leptodontidium sp. MPI-SDFR-AT-0119]|nr:heterokaryon incompatibility protein-domain-containing protein [Leptodontidium sp. MPI-SDFR-AT-0119]